MFAKFIKNKKVFILIIHIAIGNFVIEKLTHFNDVIILYWGK